MSPISRSGALCAAKWPAWSKTVQRTIAEESHQLLETIARSVVDAVRTDPRVLAVAAVVHKPGAARSLGVADVSVEATWSA